jgi:hypothetical protein
LKSICVSHQPDVYAIIDEKYGLIAVTERAQYQGQSIQFGGGESVAA